MTFAVWQILRKPFLWLEDIVLRSSVLTNGIHKGQFLGSKNFFSISFEVVWEIREAELLQIIPVIFSCKGGPISHWLSIFWTLSKFKLCTLCDSLNSEIIAICLWGILIKNPLTWSYLFFLSYYSHLVVSYLF